MLGRQSSALDLWRTRKVLLSPVNSNRTQENGIKLHQGNFRLDIRKKFFPERAAGDWNRLSREVVTASSLAKFKKHLYDTLVTGSPARRRELDFMILMGPFQFKTVYDSTALYLMYAFEYVGGISFLHPFLILLAFKSNFLFLPEKLITMLDNCGYTGICQLLKVSLWFII